MTGPESRSFYRQGAWLLTANTTAGGLMFGTQLIGMFWMPAAEHGLFGTLVAVLNMCLIPALGLQTVLAQQTAAVVSEKDRHQLTATVRAILSVIFLVWLALLVATVAFNNQLLDTFRITNPVALWFTVFAILPQLMMPLFMGVLQGRQNFLWLGMVNVANGLGRFVTVGVLVVFFGVLAAGAMFGVLLGFLLAVSIGAWWSREAWLGETEPFDWRGCLRRLVPLTLGLGSAMVLLSADLIFVRLNFEEEQTGWYHRAGLLGRGLVLFTTPLAQVMFPKVVANAVRRKKTNVLWQTIISTAALALVIAGGLTVVCFFAPPLVVGMSNSGLFGETFREILADHREQIRFVTRFLPYFLWAMIPLTVANVLINNLLALKIYRAVPWLTAVAVVYLLALAIFHASPGMIILVLALFNGLLLSTAAFFSFGKQASFRSLP